ncbi:hypothetical protein Enr17x_11450 [Gimesia fumaroli]|uniref:Uncharacterized protein n=1 Tax=Gimesia fumaroli TaxID=2527976 RepID=A0A518I7V4_9PLAN|nr:hypothetical protein Enr17x_11450 [Gimesia fumaroli]
MTLITNWSALVYEIISLILSAESFFSLGPDLSSADKRQKDNLEKSSVWVAQSRVARIDEDSSTVISWGGWHDDCRQN